MRDLSHQQIVEAARRKVPMNASLQNRIIINISGVRFETFKSTLEVYPNTLLGNAKRCKYYYDNVLHEYFFDRHRGCFEAILYYYQSNGRLRRPNSVPLDTFLEEITFFDLGQDALAQVLKDENLKEVEKTQLPRNRCRRDTIDMRDLSHQQIIDAGKRKNSMDSSLQNQVYPNTLLGNAKRRKYYYDNVLDEYFFDRHRGCFEAILYYYQSKGRLRRPNSVPLDTFLEEITFFDLGQDALSQVRKDENLKEVEKAQLPRNRCRRYIWATIEYPEFSFIAKLFNILSLIIIFISTITLALESLPQYSQLLEDTCKKEYNQHNIEMNNDSINSSNVQSSEGICLSYFSSSFHRIQMICIGFFTIELFLRLFSTPSLSMYFKKFMNWIDIIAVVPFYITNIINLVNQFGYQNINIYNSFALLRVLRCARIFKFYCVFKNIKTIRVLAVTVKESMFDFLILPLIVELHFL
ncbi:unnamed protein product [Rotaria sp. Silwood2]|nr:unnamed protein product [Rotaria sp. Silwood2]